MNADWKPAKSRFIDPIPGDHDEDGDVDLNDAASTSESTRKRAVAKSIGPEPESPRTLYARSRQCAKYSTVFALFTVPRGNARSATLVAAAIPASTRNR